MSCARPAKPSGTAAAARSCGSIGALRPAPCAPAGILPQIGVSMMPGCTELTRMLSAAVSSAADLASSRTPPLVAEQARHRRHQDDRAAAGAPHGRNGVLDRQEHAVEVDRLLALPVGERHLLE